MVTLPAPALAAPPDLTRVLTQPNLGGLDEIVSVADFNHDGFGDLLLAPWLDAEGSKKVRRKRRPLVLLLGRGDGTFRNGSRLLRGRPTVRKPIAVTGHFNRDRWLDVAVFDAGSYDTGLSVGFGNAPQLLLGSRSGRLTRSSALADAVRRSDLDNRNPRGKPFLHIKSASTGDVDGDGDVDIWVESSGGDNVNSHWMINDGRGRFRVDDERVDFEALHNPQPEFWRQFASTMVDVDGDGNLDMVLGQLRNPGPTQDRSHSFVLLNDGRGNFARDGRVPLPRPRYAKGYTQVTSIVSLDLNRDRRPDLVIAHTRTHPAHSYGYGRYIQVLVNRGRGRFRDETRRRFPDQAATTRTRSREYGGELLNSALLSLGDVDGDGTKDLILGKASQYLGDETPLVYLNSRRGRFRTLAPDHFTRGELFFGENTVAIDLNGDRVTDFVGTDSTVGPDDVFGTRDDRTDFVAMLASPRPLTFRTRRLPLARVDRRYLAELPFLGGRPPYRVTVTRGALPRGVRIRDGALHGVPRVAGRSRFTIRVRDRAGAARSARFSLRVDP